MPPKHQSGARPQRSQGHLRDENGRDEALPTLHAREDESFPELGVKERSKNLINSKSELYGNCSCKTRFLRLKAVGNEGADETASRSKTARVVASDRSGPSG